MEAGSFDGPNRNRVYGLSNTTIENLWMDHSVSTVGSSQSISSTQSQEFTTLQQHMAHLTEEYERLSVDYGELYRMTVKPLGEQS